MSYDMKRIITTPAQEQIEILKIPWFSQSPTDWKCFVCSLKMCLEYYKNEYNNSYVRHNTKPYDIEELMGITNTRETTGTIVCKSLCDVLESTQGLPFDFKYHVNYTYENIRKKIENNLPVIVIYNGQYLKEQIRGGSHAGVVVGMTEDDNVILNNPWFGPHHIPNKITFDRAWDIEYNQAFTIEPKLRQESLNNLLDQQGGAT